MKTEDFQKRLLAHIEVRSNQNTPLVDVEVPPQGMSSSVFFVRLWNGTDCAVKYGKDALRDVPVLSLIAKSSAHISVPRIIDSFVFEDVPVLILERINFPLLESVPVEAIPLYLPSIIENLKELHKITSDNPGRLIHKVEGQTWKDMQLSIFDGSSIDWDEIVEREGIDKELISNSLEEMCKKITNTQFDSQTYSLLHTDFNQRNLFVDPLQHVVAGIIDWEDAMFGDPLYDFARVRMYLWHFNQSEESIGEYYRLVNFSAEQKQLEDLYWLSRVIQYLAWYSEDLTEFNLSRIALHQEYLRNYKW